MINTLKKRVLIITFIKREAVVGENSNKRIMNLLFRVCGIVPLKTLKI